VGVAAIVGYYYDYNSCANNNSCGDNYHYNDNGCCR
jgi:hypothetical protein